MISDYTEIEAVLNKWLQEGPVTWWGLGSETEEITAPSYKRQRMSLTEDVTFTDLPEGILYLQLWDAETGGHMLAYHRLKQGPTAEGGKVVVKQQDLRSRW